MLQHLSSAAYNIIGNKRATTTICIGNVATTANNRWRHGANTSKILKQFHNQLSERSLISWLQK